MTLPTPTFLPQEIIRAKRDNVELSDEEIERFVRGLTDGSVGDGQAAAFAMAVYFRGMDVREVATLTKAMATSGATMQWPRADLHGPVIDKHSTGGVGDKVSLMLAPLIAACGGHVPMISGRGLGHTGGTLDKLESIPGYNTRPHNDLFHKVVSTVGCAIIGQTADLAPADGRLYSIRDVTATIESIPLITASILSKKLAAGLDALVMDVTYGNGAFMTGIDAAEDLARSIVTVAGSAGLRTCALLTDMNQVLGRTAGNALEVREAIDWLVGSCRDQRLTEVIYALGAEMLMISGMAPDIASARSRLIVARGAGAAAERFEEMVSTLGGPSDLLTHPTVHLRSAPVITQVGPRRNGYVQAVDTRAIGMAIVGLGGGHARIHDVVDDSVGFSDVAAVGEFVDAMRPLAVVHARNEDEARAAAEVLRAAYAIDDSPPATQDTAVARRIEAQAYCGT
jgi:thymidine phosphorylase